MASSHNHSVHSAPGQPVPAPFLAERLPTCSASYPNVLVVDDSLLTLKLTSLTLELDGHRVDKANNGEMALSLMDSHQYDVVLLDLNMPVRVLCRDCVCGDK